ncbi:MAG: DUF2914 domain-containing protein [Actinobacteria bacterium]|nr:DUF2914 domain-containing protein [Actinomycetota bacterium]
MKTIFQFKFRWILSILFVAFSFILILGFYQSKDNPQPEYSSTKTSGENVNNPKPVAAPKNNPPQQALNSHLRVNKVVVCLDISDDGRPLLAKEKFHRGVDFLVCYSELSGIDEPQVLTHRLVHENDVVAEKQVWLRKGADAVWTKYDLPRDQRGNWRVDLVSTNGRVLDYAVFQIE